MKAAGLFCLAAAAGSLLLGCQAAMVNPAPLTADTVDIGKRLGVSESTLRKGRRLFVSRCIECHTLPVAWNYTDSEWPRILRDMAHRSSLKHGEEEIILAYIRAIRAQ
jgi:mono/diheme cytochrome c family protein